MVIRCILNYIIFQKVWGTGRQAGQNYMFYLHNHATKPEATPGEGKCRQTLQFERLNNKYHYSFHPLEF